jgi:hypothetical protein
MPNLLRITILGVKKELLVKYCIDQTTGCLAALSFLIWFRSNSVLRIRIGVNNSALELPRRNLLLKQQVELFIRASLVDS